MQLDEKTWMFGCLEQEDHSLWKLKNPENDLLIFKNLTELVNTKAQGKVEVLNLSFASKDDVKRLKKGEGSSKIYQCPYRI